MPPPGYVANGDSTAAPGADDLVTVLVTGFGPFDQRFPVNPSWEIIKSLPNLLPVRDGGRPRIRIIAYDGPIRVSYKHCHALIPELLSANADAIDLVLITGMASGRAYYTAERYARRLGYSKHKDVDGEFPPPSEPDEEFGDMPDIMTTSLDYDAMLKRWQAIVRDAPEDSAACGADCRQSDDAGRFLCDYSYFNALAWFARRNSSMEGGAVSDRPVMFLHVPAQSAEADLERGRAVATALIEAMVDTLHR